MIVDARSVAAPELEADVCLIGAGAAGITLARELAETDLRVLVLESGGLEEHAPSQALYRGRVYGRSYFPLHEARTRRFGGSTHCWQGLCRPLEPADFTEREWVPDSGWPFDYAALEPDYARAQRVCGLGELAYDGAHWARPGREPLAFGGDAIESRVFQVSRLRFGEAYRGTLERAANLRVLLHANAVELVPLREAGGIDHVRVATLEGGAFRVRARRFVLATGGIENARLLLASSSVESAGVGNRHDLVGRTFMEHPHVVSGAFLPSGSEVGVDFYRAHVEEGLPVAGLLVPSEATQRREKTLAFAAFPAQHAELPSFESSLAREIGEMDGRGGDPAGQALFFINECEQAPNPESRVRLIPQKDALGMPQVQLEWRLSALDKRSIRRGHEILGAALGAAGLGRLQIMLSENDFDWPREMGGGRHHMGTTRMHPDPRRGVVDADGRVHGYANLYVAGSSVFPTSGAANPTLTLVALALRLADHLRGGLS